MAGDGSPEKLRREKAGTYRTADGRFTVEQSSSGWLLLDDEQSNELGLPLTRGPFATLDEAREAIAGARSGPPPKAEIVSIADHPRNTSGPKVSTVRGARAVDRASTSTPATEAESAHAANPARSTSAPTRARSVTAAKPAKPAKPAGPAVIVRDFRAADGEQLRKLWAACGFRSLGDDDLSLARMARRNPGLLLVASEGTRVVASALGAWDGRRGWIYHVATAESHRRQGLASKLVDQVEAALRDLGCPKVSVLVRDSNDAGRAFWRARGYDEGSRQFARELPRD